MSRRIALLTALTAVLLTPGIASAANATVTVSGSVHAFANANPTIAMGDSIVWQSINTNTLHSTTADKFGGSQFAWTYDLASGPTGTTTPDVVFSRAGGFAYHCRIHQGMRGTVMVQMQADDMTPVVGQTITITFAMNNAPAGFSEQIQKRKVGGTWANFSVGNVGTSATWKPKKAKTFQFQARLVQGNVTSNWSPILQLTVAAH